MVHELVGKIVRFGRNTYRDVVTACCLGKRHQIGHRFADARPRLNHAMRSRNECVTDLECHRDLLITRLVGGIHAIDQATWRIVCLDLLTTRHLENRQLIGVHPIVGAIGLENVSTSGAEREDRTRVLPCQE